MVTFKSLNESFESQFIGALEESTELNELFGNSKKEKRNAKKITNLQKKYRQDLRDREDADNFVDHDLAKEYYDVGNDDAKYAAYEDSKLGRARHKVFGYSNGDVKRVKDAYNDRVDELDSKINYDDINRRYKQIGNKKAVYNNK